MISILEKYNEIIKSRENGEVPKERITFNEILSSKDAAILVPKVITDTIKDSAEPQYVVTKLLQKIQLTEGKLIEFPYLGDIRAQDIPEHGAYPQEAVDVAVERVTVPAKVGKVGLIIRLSDEIVSDSQWDIVGMYLDKAGRAMARFKEEKAMKEMSKYAHVVFDNSKRSTIEAAGTTGRDRVGRFNNTLSYEDFFDMVVALMINEFVPTHAILHPLTWVCFAKSGLFGGFSLPMDNVVAIKNSVNKNNIMSIPELPFALKAIVTPFIPTDRETKTTEVFVVDGGEIGVLVEKEPISLEQFVDPYKDIHNIKVKERYAIAILNEGKAICVARKVALAPSYPFGYQLTLPIDEDRALRGE